MTTLYQALVRYANEHDLLEKPYYAPVRFLWQLDLNADGTLANPYLTPLTTTEIRRGKEQTVPGLTATVPRMTRTSGVSAMLGADDIAYVLGWCTPEADAAREVRAQAASDARHRAWGDLTRRWAYSPGAADDPIPQALVRFLNEGVKEIVRPDSWEPKDPVRVFVGGVPATEAASASEFWTSHVEATKGAGRTGVCLICGRNGSLVDTFAQPVKGPLVPGGQTSGVAPISINEAPYGYGLHRGLDHVPVCLTCAQALPTALNHLLSDRDAAHRTPDASTTWWVDGTATFDPFAVVTAPDDEAVADLISRVGTGAGTRQELTVDHFHALTVQGNASRLVIRDWTHLPLATLERNIRAWFEDIRVAPRRQGGRDYLPLWWLAEATGRYVHDPQTPGTARSGRYLRLTEKAGHHPHAVTETLHWVAFKSLPLPRDVVAHVVQRVAADGQLDERRAALLKLYLARSTTSKGTLMPGLDVENTQPAYLLGRLMAVYERAQYAAATMDGGQAPNATFVDKYLAGAITSPRLVITSGDRQAQAWLSKLARKKRDFHLRQSIDSIMSQLSPDDPGPVRASLDEQALFLLGFHHQRAHDSEAAAEYKAAKALAEAKGASATEADENDH